MYRKALFGPPAVSVAAGVVALFLQTVAIAQQTIAFGGTTDGGADVFTVVLSGSPLTFGTPTLVNNNPEPWASDQEFSPAVSALAYAQNNNSLVGSNSTYGDLYSLAGPGYGTSTQLAAPAAGFFAGSVGVESNGTIVGVGNTACDGNCPAIAVFPTGQQLPGNWTVLQSLSQYWGIGTAPDAVVATGNYGLAQTGDVLVLVGDAYGDNSNQPVILRYPQSAIANASCNGCGSVIVTQGQFPPGATANPVSFDISPVDSSILIATSDGSIWRLPYSPPTTSYGPPQLLACWVEYDVVNNVPVCQPSDGNPWGKIRATQSGGQMYILSTNPSASQVNLFSGSVAAPPFTSTSTLSLSQQYGVQPVGLAVLPTYKSGTVQAGQCIAPETCDPIGDGVELITIRDYPPTPPAYFPPTATIAEQECDAEDPRIDQYGHFNGLPLPLKLICPGLSDSTVLPGYVRGGSGPTGAGLVIIAALADQIAANSNGLEVKIQSTSTPVFSGSPTCPQNVHILASNDHSPVETTFAEGPNAFENTGFCYPDPGSGSVGPHKTIDGIGLVLDLTMFAPNGTPLQQAVAFTDFKIQNLITTINQTTVKYPWEKAVLLLGAGIDQALVNRGHYECAAELVYLLDQFVRRHRADFQPTGTAGAAVREPNGFGDIIGRLANLYLTIENRIEGKTVTWSDWPLTADPHLCHTNECNVSGLNK